MVADRGQICNHRLTSEHSPARSRRLYEVQHWFDELAQKTGVTTAEVAGVLRSRLGTLSGLHDFLRLADVVEECVTCAPPVEGCGMQLHDLNDDCWRLARNYLSFDNVKPYYVTPS
ncbi:hypothetical protein MRX96_017586 [Rhipicephalus microplus]